MPRLLAAKWKAALKTEAVDVLSEALVILAPLFVCTMPRFSCHFNSKPKSSHILDCFLPRSPVNSIWLAVITFRLNAALPGLRGEELGQHLRQLHPKFCLRQGYGEVSSW